MSVVRPPSHCPGCGEPDRAVRQHPRALVAAPPRTRPLLRGVRISPRYPLVELIGGALVARDRRERRAPRDARPTRPCSHARRGLPRGLRARAGLVAAAFIDAEHMYLPTRSPSAAPCSASRPPRFAGLGWTRRRASARRVGFVGVWLPFVVVYKALRGRSGMGMGDAKLDDARGRVVRLARRRLRALRRRGAGDRRRADRLSCVKGKIEEPEARRARTARSSQQPPPRATRRRSGLLEDDPLARAPGRGAHGGAGLPFGPFLMPRIIEWMLGGEWIAIAWFLAAPV